MKQADPDIALFHDELLIVRHSGEIPEVALHGALYFLCSDSEGPGLSLSSEEILEIKRMVLERYREMINRDLDPDNRDKGIYRGMARCLVNWQRLESFCRKEEFPLASMRKETSKMFISLIKKELDDVLHNKRSSSVNCSSAELENFADKLGLNPKDLPEDWPKLCRKKS